MAKRLRPPLKDYGDQLMARFGVSAQHERLVGRLVIEWSRVEAVMQEVIWTIIDINWENGRALTQTMDVTRKMQLLRTFSKRFAEGTELDNLNNILDCLDEYQEDRNVIVHGSWGTARENGDPVVMSLRRKTPDPDQIVFEGFSSARMYQIIDGITTCRDALIEWRKRQEALPGRRTPPLFGEK